MPAYFEPYGSEGPEMEVAHLLNNLFIGCYDVNFHQFYIFTDINILVLTNRFNTDGFIQAKATI